LADRFCRNCGHELAEGDRFCPNCGTPVREAAHVPAPEADVPVPPPPGQQQAGQTAPQQAAAPRRSTANKLLLIGCIGIVGVGVLFVGCLAILVGGGGEPAGSRSQEEQFMAGKAPPPDNMRKCSVEQPCKMGSSTLTVTAVQITDIVPITYDKPLTNGPYVFVDYTYTYGGDEVVSIAEHPQWPLQADGKRYLPDFDATSSWSIELDEDITVEDMQPGVPVKGHLVYKVTPESEDFILGVEDLIAPNKSKPAVIPILDLSLGPS
jgi:hypothetical protein